MVVERFLMGAGIDEPLAVYRLDGSYYFHTDTLGSVAAITDEDGETRNLYAYESFGKHSVSCPSHSFGKSCIPNASTYTAREWDDDLQLYNYRFRWQDPTTGRFIQEDPYYINDNKYIYVSNSPMIYTDSLGLNKTSVDYSDFSKKNIKKGIFGAVAQYVVNKLPEDMPATKELLKTYGSSGDIGFGSLITGIGATMAATTSETVVGGIAAAGVMTTGIAITGTATASTTAHGGLFLEAGGFGSVYEEIKGKVCKPKKQK